MTIPAPQVWPALRATDAPALIDFLEAAFGFRRSVVHLDEASGLVMHSELVWPLGGGVMLGSVRPGKDSWPMTPGSFGCYVVTDDADALFARAIAAGAKVVVELMDTDYGSRDFQVEDPEGNRWSFGTYCGEAWS